MDILNFYNYFISCSLALLYLKIKIKNNALKLLYIYDCLNTSNDILTLSKIKWCTLNQSCDMDIFYFINNCILGSIALLGVKVKIKKTILKLLNINDYLLFKYF